mmetsp:Transcript_52374/g.59861  ORF Transcript_52374/g.59861 Transcript_52374/m.59861 type:complete len:96 (-) Transcript_52374:220-507(-)
MFSFVSAWYCLMKKRYSIKTKRNDLHSNTGSNSTRFSFKDTERFRNTNEKNGKKVASNQKKKAKKYMLQSILVVSVVALNEIGLQKKLTLFCVSV